MEVRHMADKWPYGRRDALRGKVRSLKYWRESPKCSGKHVRTEVERNKEELAFLNT